MNDDDVTPIERPYTIAELERTKTKLVRSHDELALNELRNVLKRQQEQDLVIDELRGIVDTLALGHVASINEIQSLRRTVDTLTRHQIELHQRQDAIAQVCDAYSKRFSTLDAARAEEAKDKETP